MVYMKWYSIILIEWEQNGQSIHLQCIHTPMPNLSNCRCELMMGKLTPLFHDAYKNSTVFVKKKTKLILILQVILKFFRKMVQEFMKIPLSSVHSKSL